MAYIKPKNLSSLLIKKQTVRVEKLVGQKNKFKSIALNQKIKLRENNNRRETEESLEKYKDRGSKIKGFSTPRLGFLDSIKNFLFSVLFGSLALKLLPYLPQLKGLLITTLKVGNFAIEFAGTILNAMVTFIDKVYGIIDFGKQQAKLLGGEKGVKGYENMLGMMNKVMNSVFIAGMLFSELIVIKAQADANQSAVGDIGKEVTEEIVKRQGFRQAIQGFATKIASTVAAKVLIVGLASSLLGELSFQQRKFTKKLEGDVQNQLKEANLDPNPITRVLKLIAYNAALPGLKFYNFVSTGVGTLLDIIGAPFRYAVELLNLGIMSLTGDANGIKRQRENLGKLDARIREQIREIVNTLSLGTLAKEKGSFGSLYGSSATTAMGYASGGAVTREGQEAIGGVITRTGGKKAISRTFEIPMSPLNPGADVGGQMNYVDPTTQKPTKTSNIETFFPNPEDSKYINSYSYLTDSYSAVSSGEFIKPFLQMPIKMIMGNGSVMGDYNSLAAATNSLFINTLEKTLVPGTKKSVADELGFIDIFGWAGNAIKKSMIDPMNQLIKSLKEQFMLKPGAAPGTVDPGPTESVNIQGGDADFWTLVAIASREDGEPQAWADVAQSIYNRLASGAYGGKTIKDLITSGGQYEPTWQYPKGSANVKNKPNPEWFAIKDAASAGVAADQSEGAMKKVAEALLDKTLQKNAREFVQGRTDFKGSYVGKPPSIQRKSGDNWYGWEYNYRENKIGSVPNFGASASSSSPVIGNATEGSKIAGELGRYIDSKGLGNMGSGVHRHPEHPPYSLTSGHSAGSLHYQGRAVDIGGYTREQGPILAAVAEFNKLKGVKPVQLLHGKNDSYHTNHVHVAYEEGGPVNKTDYALTHPGEYVIDEDSKRLYGMNFYDIINKAETVSQRRNAAESLISILSQYTEDGFPETEDDYSYQVSPPQVIMIPGPVIEEYASSGSGGGGGGGSDPSQDSGELR
jgi:hypothetical protein